MDEHGVLVIVNFGIGNAVAKLPLLNNLIRLGYKPFIYADKAAVGVFEFFVPEIPVRYFSPGEIPAGFADAQRKFVILTEPSTGWFKAAAIKEQERIGEFQEWDHSGISEVNQNLSLLLQFCSRIGYSGSIDLGIFTERMFRQVPNKIGIHTGCLQNWKQKRWPVPKWRKLIELMLNAGYKITLFGQAGDFTDEKGRELFPVSESVNLFINRNRLDTFAEIATCEQFIANDSGLAKVAIAAGCRTIEIFGPTDSVKNRFKDEIVLSNDVACRPCQYQKERMLACINRRRLEISPETVFNTLEEYKI